MKSIFEMKKKEFLKLPYYKEGDPVEPFNGFVIIPLGRRNIHSDSGYRLMTYCICRDGVPLYLMGGTSDLVFGEGVCGWNIECFPTSGLLYFWTREKNLIHEKMNVSTFCVSGVTK